MNRSREAGRIRNGKSLVATRLSRPLCTLKMNTPELPANLEILKKDLGDSLSSLRKLRRGNKKKAEYVVIAAAAISALTTVSIGLISLVSNWSPFFQILALILSASLTVLTAWDGLYNHKRLWLLQAGIVNNLRQIETDLKHVEKLQDVDQNLINELYLRYRNAFEQYNLQWQEMRMDDDSPASSNTPDDVGA